jgi:hypothetical protein
MYWIYLALFILAVLVPDIVPHGATLFYLGEEQIEEVLIFILGLTGFLIFRWKERQSNEHLEEKLKIQKEANQISKSLTDTYSYIGETNRKLDIMKAMSMTLLDMTGTDFEKKKFFDSVMESIYILGKSKTFIIRFINTENNQTEQEIKSKKKIFIKSSNEEIIKNLASKSQYFIEDKQYFIIISPKEIDKTIAAIIISKNNQQQKLEDPEMLKALASQSLFLFAYLKKIPG